MGAGPDGGDGGTCPAACNLGCRPDGTCVINGGAGADVTCPPGRDCRVSCATDVDCNSVSCPAGHGCTLVCGDAGSSTFACAQTSIDSNGASSLCIDCIGSQGCPGLTCQPVGVACRVGCNGPGAQCQGVCACTRMGTPCP